ncbi:hypothetical protein M885DRAFT_532253 [Pelagophyceae sp. CCMP2097]|nr:hypothetical protein M885DRAFT_532253 [Pelagophyceae sp. CCMP2097]
MALLNYSGSLFCGHCGGFVSLPDKEPIVCDGCGSAMTFEESGLGRPEMAVSHALYAKPRPVPTWAKDADDAPELNSDAPTKRARAVIDEMCPECNHPQLEFYTMQLRSVDEGQTVFYECLKCHHKFSQNN